MNTFERNSMHLNAAGYMFGMGIVSGESAKKIAPHETDLMVPMWINVVESSNGILRVILGSEPKLGENEEIRIPMYDIKNLVYTEPKKVK